MNFYEKQTKLLDAKTDKEIRDVIGTLTSNQKDIVIFALLKQFKNAQEGKELFSTEG